MKIPAELNPICWAAAGGAIALAIVGFTWGGWVTGGTAEAQAKQRADRAVVAALTPICVDKFPAAGQCREQLGRTAEDQQLAAGHVRREGRLGHNAGRDRAGNWRRVSLRGNLAQAGHLIAGPEAASRTPARCGPNRMARSCTMARLA